MASERPDVPNELVETAVNALLHELGIPRSSPCGLAYEREVRSILAAVLPAHEDTVRAAIVKDIKHYFASVDDSLYDDVITLCGRIERGEYGHVDPPDHLACQTVEIDGGPVRVQADQPLTDDDRAALTELVGAAKRRMEAEQAAERAEIERQVRQVTLAKIEADFRTHEPTLDELWNVVRENLESRRG
jgi:hypothetical protein